MKTYSFTRSALLGLVISVLSVGGFVVLSHWLGQYVALKLVTVFAAGSYGAYLMQVSQVRTGRLVVPIAWFVLSTALLWLSDPITVMFGQTACIWLVRTLYVQTSALASVADAVLGACSIGAAIWALQSSNLLLAFWSFFLVQSLSVWIPRQRPRKSVHSDQAFQAAAKNAEAALRRITTP